MKKLTVIIPALNEAPSISRVVGSIPCVALESQGIETEILVVDNGSSDGTRERARLAGAHVVDEPRRGYGRAIKTGIENAKGDLLVKIDGDLTYPPEVIPTIVQLITHDEFLFITTNRFNGIAPGAMTLRNWLGNQALSVATRQLFALDIKDSQSGMWGLIREIVPPLWLLSDDAAFSQELKIEAARRAQDRWMELSIAYLPRTGFAKLGNWQTGTRNLVKLCTKYLSEEFTRCRQPAQAEK